MNLTTENTSPTPNEAFARLGGDQQIERTAQALEAHGIHTFVAANAAEARTKLFELLPAAAEVFLAASGTLTELGVPE
jgi:L-lactate utilization protein LutB